MEVELEIFGKRPKCGVKGSERSNINSGILIFLIVYSWAALPCGMDEQDEFGVC